MTKKFDWMKKSLMGSTTMPMAGGLMAGPGHSHAADGSCCGHDHGHGHHHHGHDHSGHSHHHHHDGACCDHDHGAEGDDQTSPKGCC